jgi:murein DD-endopeptidase MepM/ murein hydrolase activator NlpD
MLIVVTSLRRFLAKLRKRRLIIALLLFLLCTGLLAIQMTGQTRKNGPACLASGTGASQTASRVQTNRGSLKPGETISSLLKDVFTPGEIHDLAIECRKVYPLRNICAGRSYALSLVDGDFKSFACDIDDSEQLVISRDKNGFSAAREPIPFTVEVVTVKGTIESSLFEAMVKSGESEALAMELADIFAWDIDFFHDIQPGDSFEVMFERRYRDGRPAGNGRLLAAQFTNQDRISQAFYFKDGNSPPDYYDENGRSLRKAFLKAPLQFSRISSGFNMHRLHPITHRIKAHPAIDFAAPTGTPIHTVGDGTVIFAAYKRYNGNCVKVRHPNGWVTMYNHMSRFARNIRAGKRLSQGEVIGYVGSTGLATGPHLDFRMYRQGVAVNPLKVKSPPARPVSTANMAAFRVMVAKRVALMENGAKRETSQVYLPAKGTAGGNPA